MEISDLSSSEMDAVNRVITIARKDGGSATKDHIKEAYAEWRSGWEDMYVKAERALELAVEVGYFNKPMRHGGTQSYGVAEKAP